MKILLLLFFTFQFVMAFDETPRILGTFHQKALETEVNKWWGLEAGTVEFVKMESGAINLQTAYERIRDSRPLRGQALETVVEGTRQWGRDYCVNMGANFNIKAPFCQGEKNYIYFKGLPEHTPNTRVVCQTNTISRREPSIKISNCYVVTPRGNSGHSRFAFQGRNEGYQRHRTREFSKSELESLSQELILVDIGISDPGSNEVTGFDSSETQPTMVAPIDKTFPKQKSFGRIYSSGNGNIQNGYYYGGYAGGYYYGRRSGGSYYGGWYGAYYYGSPRCGYYGGPRCGYYYNH